MDSRTKREKIVDTLIFWGVPIVALALIAVTIVAP